MEASTHGRVSILRAEDEDPASSMPDLDANMEDLINYRKAHQRPRVRYQPYAISHIFYHARNFFLFSHNLRSMPGAHPSMGIRINGEIKIECLGRSTKPIRNLIEDAQIYYLHRSSHSTNICRANGQNWAVIGRRPARDINTVILDQTKKKALLRDINEYLHPTTKKWYGKHGIPYRRGYLFSGPPGTGKTSLTAALAGVFGLDIYVLSLLDPYINEDALTRLFSTVPPRSIVLLEDIDAAGITNKRRKKPSRWPTPEAHMAMPLGAPGDFPLSGPGGLPPPPLPPPATKTGISLSSLLNAIDGVSSSEGHVLIMTTNFPELLDKALVRPGRVDLHVNFTLPHRPEIVEMFANMYHDLASDAKKRDDAPDKPQEPAADGVANGTVHPPAEPLTTDDVDALAAAFADHVPEGKLSLAAIQGHLLRFKKDPRGAVAAAEKWVEEALKEEEEKEAEKKNDEEEAKKKKDEEAAAKTEGAGKAAEKDEVAVEDSGRAGGNAGEEGDVKSGEVGEKADLKQCEDNNNKKVGESEKKEDDALEVEKLSQNEKKEEDALEVEKFSQSETESGSTEKSEESSTV